MRYDLPLVLLTLSMSLTAQSSQPLTADRAPGAASVSEEDLREWLGILASEEYGGRGTGQIGFHKAAVLVRDHFKALGLKALDKKGSYWQPLGWKNTGASQDSHLTVKSGRKVVCKLTPGQGLHGRASAKAKGAGKVVLIVLKEADGAGIDKLDLKGRVVFVYLPEGLGNDRQSFSAMRRIQSSLRKADPAAFAIVDDAQATGELAGTSGASGSRNRVFRGRNMMPNSLYVSTATLDTILEAAGRSRDQIGEEDFLIQLPRLSAQLDIEMTETDAPAYNVIGVLPGSDRKLAKEYVVIGSHLDHLGRRNNTYYPGADDDGSGSTGVLAVSQMFAKNPTRPRRSILFVAFCGEEMGLRGSDYFARNPPIPLSSIVAELQMDMIGRDEESNTEKAEDNLNSLHLIGTQKLSKDLHDLCVQRNADFAGFDYEWDEEDVFYRSDHWSFAKFGVPIAFFFTGFHADYHRDTDTPDKINYAKLHRVAKLVYDIGFELAQQDQRPLIDPQRWSSLKRKASAKPAAPLRKAR